MQTRKHGPNDRTAELGRIGIIGVLCFAGTFVALHAIQHDLNPIEHWGSDYAHGRAGWLMRLGFLAAGAGTLAIAIGLAHSLGLVRLRRVAVVLLTLSGVGFVGSGLFNGAPPPPEYDPDNYLTEYMLHDLFGFLLFLTLIINAFVLASVFRRDARWRGFASTAMLFGVLLAAGLISTIVAAESAPAETGGVGGVTGLAQRAFIALFLIWLVILGRGVYRLGAAPEQHRAFPSPGS